MKAQYENKVISSFLLWFDHTLLKKGEAFTNIGTNFFDILTSYYGYETYGAPFKQFVSDQSIPNANMISGLYVTGDFRDIGEGGLVDINFSEGQAYFNHAIDQTQISGNYAVKDFNVYLTNRLEQDLLFETKIDLRPKTTQTITGLAPNKIAYPAVFIKNNGGTNEPFAFGGQDCTKNEVRALVLADSSFSLDAVCSVFMDSVRQDISIIDEAYYPFNALGGLKNGDVYNYETLSANFEDKVYIKEVDVSRYDAGYMSDMTNANPDVFSAIIDFELNSFRYPRLT